MAVTRAHSWRRPSTRDVRRGLRWAADHLLGFRYREKRLKLDGLPPASQRMTIAGLVAIGVLMALVAYPRALRFGTTLYVGHGRIGAAAPAAGLFAMAITATVTVYGAGLCGWPLRVATAAAFMTLFAITANAAGGAHSTPWLTVAGISSQVCYLAIPGGLVLSALSTRPALRLTRAEPWLRAVATAGTAGFFIILLVLYLAGSPFVSEAIASDFDFNLDIAGFAVMPLVMIAALSVVTFAYGIGQVTVGALRTAGPRLAWPMLTALVLAEALMLGWRQYRAWGSHPARDVAVAAWLVAFAGIGYLLRRWPQEPQTVEDQGFGTHAVLTLAAPQLVYPAIIAAFFLFISKYTRIPAVANLLMPISSVSLDNRITNDATRLLFTMMLVIALRVAIARSEPLTRRRLALGYVFISAWVLGSYLPGPLSAPSAPAVPVLPSLPQIPLLISLGVLGVLAVRRGRVQPAELGLLTGVVAFGWLAETNGGFLGIIGKIPGFPAKLTLLAGIALTLLGNSEFAGRDSKLIPHRARAPLWTGYIGVTLTLTLLSLIVGQAAKMKTGVEPSSLVVGYQADDWSASSFSEIGLPLAAWMLLTGWLQPKPADALNSRQAKASSSQPNSASRGTPASFSE